MQIASAACVGDGNGADGGQELNQLGVDTSLLAFDVRGVDQEFCAVRLEESDVFWSYQQALWIKFANERSIVGIACLADLIGL